MEKNKEPNKANDSSMEVLASLDQFQTVIDTIQEHQEENKKRLNYQKESITQYVNSVSESRSLLKELSQIKLLKFDFEAFIDSKENYEIKLQEKIGIQKKATEEGRRNQNKSFLELLQQLNQSNEERMIFNKIKAMAVDAGTKLSSFLVGCFLVIFLSEDTQLETMIQDVKNVIKSESLEENSVIIKKFISVMEFLSKEMGSDKTEGDTKKKGDPYIMSGYDALRKIYSEVLNLEVTFCRPFFKTSPANRQVLQRIEKHIRALLAPKLEDLSSYVKELELETPRGKKLKNRLNVGIKKLWKTLDLQLKN